MTLLPGMIRLTPSGFLGMAVPEIGFEKDLRCPGVSDRLNTRICFSI